MTGLGGVLRRLIDAHSALGELDGGAGDHVGRKRIFGTAVGGGSGDGRVRAVGPLLAFHIPDSGVCGVEPGAVISGGTGVETLLAAVLGARNIGNNAGTLSLGRALEELGVLRGDVLGGDVGGVVGLEADELGGAHRGSGGEAGGGEQPGGAGERHCCFAGDVDISKW